MFEIEGKYTKAKIYTDNVEPEALSQIYSICNHPVFEGESVRIMPDCHAGAGCVIGFTATMQSDKVIPNLIGVDIGCGMITVNLGKIDIDLQSLDNFIRKEIPHGSNINKGRDFLTGKIRDKIYGVCKNINDIEKFDYYCKSIGSLGSGNHFIEVSTDKKNNQYLIIHSGSRNFGYRIAHYYQKLAETYCNLDNFSKDLAYLEGELSDKYIQDMKFAQNYASENRKLIAKRIAVFLNIHEYDYFETIHNYIDETNVIRKGAISASLDELVLIPLNMRDGSILAKGRGNIDWNYSAPHGAGRIMSRSKAKKELNLEEYKNYMEGIYTTSVSEFTLDEAPMAYKNMNEIIQNIGDTVDIIDILKPKYNFKA